MLLLSVNMDIQINLITHFPIWARVLVMTNLTLELLLMIFCPHGLCCGKHSLHNCPSTRVACTVFSSAVLQSVERLQQACCLLPLARLTHAA